MNSKTKSLDNLDRRILKELQLNARISVSEIGRRVGLSTPAVTERIAKLEQEDIIQGYQTKINYDKLGLAIKVFVHFKSLALKHADVVKMIDVIPQITEWHTITGDNCALLKVVVPTTQELERVIERLGQFGETVTSIILSSNMKPKIIK
jgi:Lrp/AsnC family transcriptional regulator, leucine-responsive regulatory protein